MPAFLGLNHFLQALGAVKRLKKMNAADLRQKTGPGVESLRGGHRRRLSLSSLSLGDDVNTNEGNNILGLESESFNYNYAVICSSGSGRHKRSYSLSSNSSSSSLSSPLWSPCSSAGKSQAAIPFSWEDRPGVPKHKPVVCNVRHRELPPPPSSDQQHCSARRSLRRAKKRSDDPFVTALVECTRTRNRQSIPDAGAGTDRGKPGGQGQRYSCMRACAIVDAHIAVPRKQLTHPTSIKHNADADTALEPLLNCALQCNKPGNGELCRSGSKDNVVGTKVLREQRPLSFVQSSAWDLEFSRSLLHR